MSNLEQRLNMHVAYAPAWLVGGVIGGCLTWVGRESTDGMLAGVIAGVVIFMVTAMIGAGRRREAIMREQLRGRREETSNEDPILASIPAMVWRTNNRSNRTFVSARFQEYTGVSDSSISTTQWEDFVLPEDWQRALGAHRMAWLKHEPYTVQYRLRNAAGEYRWVIDYGAPCFHVDGVFYGYVGVVIDIHEWRTSGDAGSVDTETLRNRCDALSRETTELIAKCEQLESDSVSIRKAEESKSDFIAALAEELAGPVEESQNAVELLQSSELKETQNGYVDRLRTSTNAMGCILLRCFELATSAQDRQKLEENEVELRSLLKWTWKQLEEAASVRGVDFVSRMDDEVPLVVASDLDRMRNAIVGLQKIALEVMAHGGMVVEANMETTPSGTSMLRLSCVRAGDDVPLTLIERAFYPHDAIGGEGPGLGLHGPRRDAQALGGDVGLNQHGDGSVEFWLNIHIDSLGADGRQYGRLGQEAVVSNLGPVLDLSMGGMRVRCREVPEYVFNVQLSDEQDSLHLRAEVAWARPLDKGHHDVGLRFVELKPSDAQRLSRLAGRNRQRCTFEPAA